ncbi:MAG: CHAD domain-containing protein [Streptosporangiaceae bacterium]
MTVAASETETKYDAPAGVCLPRLDDLPQVAGISGPKEQRLEAVYYDTGDLRLIRAGVTLRRRQGGDDAGWHLKLPAGASTRTEIRLPVGRTGQRVPGELAGLVRVHTRGEPLRPVARMTTVRQVLVLLDEGGEALAEVAADDVRAQTLGSTTTVSRWNEVEIELVNGDWQLLQAADDLLRREGLRRAGRTAKLERALGLQSPAPARGLALRPSSSAGQLVLAYLREQIKALKSMDPMVRRDEPDSVHKMRVATRRLRSTLRSFRKIIRPDPASELAAELKWLGGVLGQARDAEVLSRHLQTQLRSTPVEQVIGPVQARIQGHFPPIREAARKTAVAALDSERYFALLDQLDQLLADPPFGPDADKPAARAVIKAVRQSYRKTAQRARQAWAAADGQPRDAALHQARKAAKRARYAGEVASPAFGKPARLFTKQIKRLQTILGDHQDTVIARQQERQLGINAHLAGENSFTYGLLYADDAHAAQQLQREARRTWKQAARGRYRKWLR